MSAHTREPWKLGAPSDAVVVDVPPDVNPNDPSILYYGGHLICESASDANRRRIVACVNACAGIPTEEMEPGEYERHIIETGLEIGRLTAQRDELLSTLKSLMDAAGQWTERSEALQLAHFQAHIVIAKARGVTK